jgi:hypothetical protein
LRWDHTYACTYSYSHGYVHRDTFPNTDGYSYRYRYGHGSTHTYADTDSDADADASAAVRDLHEPDGYRYPR